MKRSTDSQKDKTGFLSELEYHLEGKMHSYLRFGKWVLLFLLVMVVIFLYLVFADLSTAPRFVYSQF